MKEYGSFNDYNVEILCCLDADSLARKLCESTFYVHTAYIENSPNAICEAQYLGIPIISTNVGGISSLVRDIIDGVLVAANDPWQMVYAIKELAIDVNRQKFYSQNTREFALARHNPQHILDELMDCYKALVR